MTTNPSETAGALLPSDIMTDVDIARRDLTIAFLRYEKLLASSGPTSPPQPRAQEVTKEVNDAYDAIERYLRNSLHDDEYAEYAGYLQTVFEHAPRSGSAVAPVARVVSQAVLQAAYENRPNGQHGVGTEFVSGWTACLEYLAREVASPPRTDTESGQCWREPTIEEADKLCERFVSLRLEGRQDDRAGAMLAALKHIGCVIPVSKDQEGTGAT